MHAIRPSLLLLLTACASFERLGPGYSEGLDDYQTQNADSSGEGNNFSPSEQSVGLLSETECFNPCTFKAQTEDAAYVIYSADEWVIGQVANQKPTLA